MVLFCRPGEEVNEVEGHPVCHQRGQFCDGRLLLHATQPLL